MNLPVRMRGKSFQFMELNQRRSTDFFTVEKSVCKFEIVISFLSVRVGSNLTACAFLLLPIQALFLLLIANYA